LKERKKIKMKKFSKDILENGMFVETRDYSMGIYIKGFIFFMGDVFSIEEFNHDGTYCDGEMNHNDIINIYELHDNFEGSMELEDLRELLDTPELLTVVWERGVDYKRTFNPTQHITVSPVLKTGYFDVENWEDCLEIKKENRGYGGYNFISLTEEEVRGLAMSLNEWVRDVEDLRG
jgi:hypothetical protein